MNTRTAIAALAAALFLLGLRAAEVGAARTPDGAWHALTSNDGAHRLRYRTTPAHLELGLDFDVEVELLPAHADQPVPDLALTIDGDMPEHGHGLLRDPRTERLGPGRFRARGLRLFMPGHWELYFDVTAGTVTERAQVEVWID